METLTLSPPTPDHSNSPPVDDGNHVNQSGNVSDIATLHRLATNHLLRPVETMDSSTCTPEEYRQFGIQSRANRPMICAGYVSSARRALEQPRALQQRSTQPESISTPTLPPPVQTIDSHIRLPVDDALDLEPPGYFAPPPYEPTEKPPDYSTGELTWHAIFESRKRGIPLTPEQERWLKRARCFHIVLWLVIMPMQIAIVFILIKFLMK